MNMSATQSIAPRYQHGAPKGAPYGAKRIAEFGAARPAGGVGPIRIDFAVPRQALQKAGIGYQIFQPVPSTPIYNFRVHAPKGVIIPARPQ
jgi:hypothetical protein